jgi:hypothetical protein
LGTAHAITGNAANNTAKTKTPNLRMNVNKVIVGQLQIRRNGAAKGSDYSGDPIWRANGHFPSTSRSK